MALMGVGKIREITSGLGTQVVSDKCYEHASDVAKLLESTTHLNRRYWFREVKGE